MQVGEQLAVDEIAEVIAGQRGIVVELAILALGRGPGFPTIRLVENERVFLPVQFRFFSLLFYFYTSRTARRLLRVIEFRGAAGFLPEDVVNIFEGLFEHFG